VASDLTKLSINMYTTREQWGFREAVEGYARHNIRGVSVSHTKLREVGMTEASQILCDHDMTVTGYCIGGLLTDNDQRLFQKAIDENLRVIDEAAEVGARCIVFVAGGLPEGSKDLAGARGRCLEGLHDILPHARERGVTIGLEPLHPMTSAFRSCLTTLGEANDWIEQLGAGSELSVVVDVYHVWWDPNLERAVERSRGRISAFHVCDWLRDTVDLRVDRGMMGDGVIDIPWIRSLIEATGYDGFHEVEIFSERNWWRRNPDEVVKTAKERYLQFV
jgi:sugar phosphate isomerase/epimerase